MVVSTLFGVAGFVFLMFVFPDCESSSRKGRMVKSLPPERFAELYAAMAKLRNALPPDERLRRGDLSGQKIPREFADLNCRIVRPGSDYPLIRLQGCMDHYLDMVFFGLGEPAGSRDNSPRIELWSGEHPVIQELLWKPGSVPPATPGSGK